MREDSRSKLLTQKEEETLASLRALDRKRIQGLLDQLEDPEIDSDTPDVDEWFTHGHSSEED